MPVVKRDDSVIYLRGVLSKELESILQFIYLGQATFYQDRMNEFLNVAKILEIKALNSQNVNESYVNKETTDVSEETECNKDIEKQENIGSAKNPNELTLNS